MYNKIISTKSNNINVAIIYVHHNGNREIPVEYMFILVSYENNFSVVFQ